MRYLFAKWDVSSYLCNVTKKHKIMETINIVIARNYDQELFYLKKFKNKYEAIAHGERITFQYKGCVIAYIKEKKTGHRWEVDIVESNNEGINISTIVVYSKKSAKLAAKKIEEYDNTIKTRISKIY